MTQVLLMASPLSTIYKAIQQRTSASFHLGLCAMGLVTSTMWVIFALVSTRPSQCMSNPCVHAEMKQVPGHLLAHKSYIYS